MFQLGLYYITIAISLSTFSLVQTQKTSLDSPENIEALRNIRRFLIQVVGKTGTEERFLHDASKNGRVQLQVYDHKPFPCNVAVGRSKNVPTSVHKLRPGDIDVIGAMGDSLTAGLGLFSTNILHLLVENRGASALGGGQGTWRQYLTIPNIIKEFNPNLIGYAIGDSLTIDGASAFNVAESGAMTIDIPYMAEILVQRIVNHPKVDNEKHWKLINIMIGSNDFCLNMCYERDPWDIIEFHKNNLVQALRTIRDNLPRTMVSIVNTPHLRTLVEITGRSSFQKLAVLFECPCLFGLKYQKRLQEFYRIIDRWRKVEDEVSQYPEFNREDFTVITQPVLANVSFPTKGNGYTDLSYFASDTFHVSQKTNARFSNSLWNNFLQPAGKKSLTWTKTFQKFLCPTPKRPYLYTWYN